MVFLSTNISRISYRVLDTAVDVGTKQTKTTTSMEVATEVGKLQQRTKASCSA